jgi:hypothetical protein
MMSPANFPTMGHVSSVLCPVTSYVRFSVVNNGGLSISTASGRIKTEVVSPFDIQPRLSISVQNNFLSSMHRSRVILIFRSSIMAEC